jgi:hypothetical protein
MVDNDKRSSAKMKLTLLTGGDFSILDAKLDS